APGHITTYAHATNGDLLSITNPTTKTVTFSDYDPYGNAKTITNAAGNRTEQTFDTRSRLKTRDVFGGGQRLSHEEITYDDLDRKLLDIISDIYLGSPEQKTIYTYYPDGGPHAGQVETITNPLGHVTKFYYEAKTNRLQQKVELGVEQGGAAGGVQDIVTDYRYDEVNNLVQESQDWE